MPTPPIPSGYHSGIPGITVNDGDASIAEGTKELRRVKERFHGVRSGTLEDPFEHVWTILTRIEHVFYGRN